MRAEGSPNSPSLLSPCLPQTCAQIKQLLLQHFASVAQPALSIERQIHALDIWQAAAGVEHLMACGDDPPREQTDAQTRGHC